MFFQKTIESCHTKQINLTSEILKILQTSGIAANLADLTLDENGIYLPLPNQTTIKVMLYQAKIQESLFRTQGEPLVHLSACGESLKNYKNADFLAIIHTDMQFFLGIYSHKIQTKIFNQKPLNLCPHCHNLLHRSYQGNLQLFFEK